MPPSGGNSSGKKGGVKGKDGAPDKREKKRKPKLTADELLRQLPFRRGPGAQLKGVEDKKLKGLLKKTNEVYESAVASAAKAELLLPSQAGFVEAEGMERTFQFQQTAIAQAVGQDTSAKAFDLKLDQFGPYRTSFTRNGRYLLVGGSKGHVCMMDWMKGKVTCDLKLNETVRDVAVLHNETLFAVAQRKCVYFYDRDGLETHCLKRHADVHRLQFLPYHFLLASVGRAGMLRFQDTSTGEVVAEWRTKLGQCDAMAQNPFNAVLTLGHKNGRATMWTPNMAQPVVQMLCHHGAVNDVAVDSSGNYLVTAGADGQVKVWDCRTFKELHSYYSVRPATSLDISQRGILSVGFGPHVHLWRDALSTKATSPYLKHMYAGETVESVRFCPFEDVLCVGRSKGVSTMLVPGAGEPNFDTFEANPFQTKSQRREHEVHALLEKLQPEMITIDPQSVGTVELSRNKKAVGTVYGDGSVEKAKDKEKVEVKYKKRGKSTAAKRFKRKQKVINVKRRDKASADVKGKRASEKADKTEKYGAVLSRFAM